MFTQPNEEKFFLESIENTHKVLEYGSGYSTNQIAAKCKEVFSFEHNKQWYDKLKPNINSNCKLFFIPAVNYDNKGDGNYSQFKEYVEAPLQFAPYDIILIDGRARVACSSLCEKLGHNNTLVFIHDFQRVEYQPALNFLEKIECVGTMCKFKIKQLK